MSVIITQVDAFTDKPFAGNPAAVCVLDGAVDDAWMASVAAEMNLSETAFLRRRPEGYDLRWFTPTVEVELCGHATLASAHVLWELGLIKPDEEARFFTKSGLLTAVQHDGLIEMDFPSREAAACDAPAGLIEALCGAAGAAAVRFVGRTKYDYLVEVDSESRVRALTPDFHALRGLDIRGVIVTARGETGGFDFVSRFFAPGSGIDEDPVTGSAHCSLAPHWHSRLARAQFVAYQASRRGGVVRVHVAGGRVRLAGNAVTVMRAELLV